jgi:hypothetical protein
MSSIEVITNQWPVCFIKLDGEQTAADMETYISAFNHFYDKKQPFAVISWLKKYSAKGELVARVGKWFKETDPLIRKYWVSNAMVSQSAGFRFLLSAVFLVKPLPIAYKVCAAGEEAIAFTRVSWKGPERLPHDLHWPF